MTTETKALIASHRSRMVESSADLWYRFGTDCCVLSVQIAYDCGHAGRGGRSGTHRQRLRLGWGPKGRWFKSSRPDYFTVDPAERVPSVPVVPQQSFARFRLRQLVIWGERDSYLGSELAEPDREDVPNLDRVERLADASHWVHHDEADRVNQLLTDFFAPAA